jgi:hypothetical protein
MVKPGATFQAMTDGELLDALDKFARTKVMIWEIGLGGPESNYGIVLGYGTEHDSRSEDSQVRAVIRAFLANGGGF